MRIAIQGLGVSCAFGNGVEALRGALQGNKSALHYSSFAHNGQVESLPAYRASLDGLDEFVQKRALRRIDHFSKLTLLGACLALKDAKLLDADRSRMGVVIATGYGTLKTTFNFLDSYLDFGYACSSPTHFSNSVHNAAAAHLSMQLHMTAPSLTVTQFEMSVPSALLTAQQWLAEGRVDQVLFGAIDEYADLLHYCRNEFFGAAEQGPMQPFAFAEQSAVVGEGATFLVLTRAEEQVAYACIDSVKLGNHTACPVTLPTDDLIILGADGHKECGKLYAQALQGRAASAYAPLYGSFPAAAAVDLAVAALSLRDRVLYASPDPAGTAETALASQALLDDTGLACLKFGPAGDYGLIRLSA